MGLSLEKDVRALDGDGAGWPPAANHMLLVL